MKVQLEQIRKSDSMSENYFIAIDLKSFYASVECNDRGLDSLDTHLVVADSSRTEKTICLAVSPSLKNYGIPGRARLFEVVQKVKEINQKRLQNAPGNQFCGSSASAAELAKHPEYALDYFVAPPRMARYLACSTQIYEIYLRYFAPEDIHVYSIDEVFIDVTHYLNHYHATPHELAKRLIHDVMTETKITATAGIGTNLYLCKVAMDVVAKHIPSDSDGVRIADLDELSYRKLLWNHRPLTDFWRVGRGYRKKLEANGLYTMGDIARCSLGGPNDYYNQDFLYKLFGINAELLIDHAWGYEPCTMADIKAYRPSSNCLSSGQVLSCPYSFTKGRIIVLEMAEMLALDLVSKRLCTNQLVLTIGYDVENLKNPSLMAKYQGKLRADHYGRNSLEGAHGTVNLKQYSSSSSEIMTALEKLYTQIVAPDFSIRRVTITANHVISEKEALQQNSYQQMDLFQDFLTPTSEDPSDLSQKNQDRERAMQEAMLQIKDRYGKNAILRGLNFEEGATTIQRNQQIGGHKA